MKRLLVGVIGHVDHGKSALVRALTGIDTDRLPEEKRRGISIALGFAHFTAAPDTVVDLIDMPGHERFVRTMIAGATGIDAVLLVVAANEGIKPQTREHVDIAALLGLRRAVIAVSKADLADPAAAAREAAALVGRAGLLAPAPIAVSAVTGEGVGALRQALAEAGEGERTADGVAFLPVDRAFSVAGHGTVVTGTLRGGPLAAGDPLELAPGGRAVRVRALQMHGVRVARAAPGQRVAVNLRDVEPAQLPRGAALTAPGALPPSEWLTVQLRAMDGAPPLHTGAGLRALFGTAEIEARLRLLDRDVLEPGQTGLAQIRCAEPVAVPAREHLVLRQSSPPLTVAGGRILEPEARRLRRHASEILDWLGVLAGAEPDAILMHWLERCGPRGTTLRSLSRLTGLAPPNVAARLQRAPVVIGKRCVVAKAAFEAVLARISATLARGALGREKLLAALPEVGPDVLDEALALLVPSGMLRAQGGVFALKRPAQEREAAQQEARLAAALAEALRRAGLAPPDPETVATTHAARRALERLLREGVIVRAHDRVQKRDVLFHRDAVAQAQRLLAPLMQAAPGLLVGEAGAALGISRKYSVPLLEHLDSIRFTRRQGDRRVLAQVDAAL